MKFTMTEHVQIGVADRTEDPHGLTLDQFASKHDFVQLAQLRAQHHLAGLTVRPDKTDDDSRLAVNGKAFGYKVVSVPAEGFFDEVRPGGKIQRRIFFHGRDLETPGPIKPAGEHLSSC
jgi:hypothetical protein